jgi:hypothetical protein
VVVVVSKADVVVVVSKADAVVGFEGGCGREALCFNTTWVFQLDGTVRSGSMAK